MKIIFLDIDGVLNCESAYKQGQCKYVDFIGDDGKEDYYQSFYSPAKFYLNLLIKETGAKIVISSSWRKVGLDKMRTIWEKEGMSGEIIDTTPSLYLQRGGSIQFWNGYEKSHPTPKIKGYSIPRGSEIEYWLKEKNFYHVNWSKEEQLSVMKNSRIENYIIIDDDSDMLYKQRNNFVHVFPSPRNTEGFNEHFYNIAKEKLSGTVIDLNY